MFYQSFKMAIKAIAGNKMRSFLTILGVVIGVVSIVVLVSIGQGTTSSVTSQIEGMGTDLLTVTIFARNANPLTLDGLTDLSKDDSIAYLSPTVNVSGTVKAGNTTYDDGSVQGVTESYHLIKDWEVASGRFLQVPDVENRIFAAVIGSEACEEMFGSANAVGETFSINGYSFTVVGVLAENEDSSTGSNNNQILIPFTVAERVFTTKGISSFSVSASSSDRVAETQAVLEAYLADEFAKYNTSSNSTQYSVYNQSEMLETLSATTATLTLMLGGIAGISLLVGGIGIMNIMLVSVSERTREIGIRKAIGASRCNILVQFLIESLVVSLLGGLLGLGISIGALDVLAPMLDMTLTVPMDVAWLAIGFSLFIGVVFGMYPANKASKLHPIQALRYEG